MNLKYKKYFHYGFVAVIIYLADAFTVHDFFIFEALKCKVKQQKWKWNNANYKNGYCENCSVKTITKDFNTYWPAHITAIELKRKIK